MRRGGQNVFPGKCYVCGNTVEPLTGYFQRFAGKFLVKHKGCKATYQDRKLIINKKSCIK